MEPLKTEHSLLNLFVVVNRNSRLAFVMDEGEAEAYAHTCQAYLGNTRRGWYTDAGPIDICLFPNFDNVMFMHFGAYSMTMSAAMLILTQADF